MTVVEISAVIGALTSIVIIFLGVLNLNITIRRFHENQLEIRKKEMTSLKDDIKSDFNTVWSRFDDVKVGTDAKIKNVITLVETSFLRKDVWEANHKHFEQLMNQQYNSLKDLMDQRLRSIEDSIKHFVSSKINERKESS